jgi:hypothetical protein
MDFFRNLLSIRASPNSNLQQSEVSDHSVSALGTSQATETEWSEISTASDRSGSACNRNDDEPDDDDDKDDSVPLPRRGPKRIKVEMNRHMSSGTRVLRRFQNYFSPHHKQTNKQTDRTNKQTNKPID